MRGPPGVHGRACRAGGRRRQSPDRRSGARLAAAAARCPVPPGPGGLGGLGRLLWAALAGGGRARAPRRGRTAPGLVGPRPPGRPDRLRRPRPHEHRDPPVPRRGGGCGCQLTGRQRARLLSLGPPPERCGRVPGAATGPDLRGTAGRLALGHRTRCARRRRGLDVARRAQPRARRRRRVALRGPGPAPRGMASPPSCGGP